MMSFEYALQTLLCKRTKGPFLSFFFILTLSPALHYMSLCIFVPYQYSIEFMFVILYLGSCAVGLQIFHSFSGMAPSK